MTGVQKGIKIAAIVLAIFIICLIINAILALVGSFAYEGDVDFVETFTSVDDIVVDLNTINLEIRSGVEFKVEASNVTNRFNVRERNNCLYIEDDSFWLFGNNNAGKVIVYVPLYLDELNIDTGAGTVVINDIRARYLELDQGAGILEINNSQFDKAEVDGGAGTIKVDNSIFTNLELDTGVGEINFNGQILGNSVIDSGIGEVNLTLAGGENLYELIIDKGIGDFKINGEDYGRSSYGNGINKIKLNNGVGEVNVNFE